MTSNKPGRGKGPKKDNSRKFNHNKCTIIKDEDLKFYIGDQQAEKYDKIIKHLAMF